MFFQTSYNKPVYKVLGRWHIYRLTFICKSDRNKCVCSWLSVVEKQALNLLFKISFIAKIF